MTPEGSPQTPPDPQLNRPVPWWRILLAFAAGLAVFLAIALVTHDFGWGQVVSGAITMAAVLAILVWRCHAYTSHETL